MAGAKLGQGGGQHPPAEALRGADPDRAADDVLLAHLGGEVHRSFGREAGVQQPRARGGQPQALGRTHEQGRLERGLQRRDPPPDGRGVHAELAAPRRWRLGARGRDEHPQIVPIEHAAYDLQKCRSKLQKRISWRRAGGL